MANTTKFPFAWLHIAMLVFASPIILAQDYYGGMDEKEFKRFMKRELDNGNSIKWSHESGLTVEPNVDYAEHIVHDAERRMKKAKRER